MPYSLEINLVFFVLAQFHPKKVTSQSLCCALILNIEECNIQQSESTECTTPPAALHQSNNSNSNSSRNRNSNHMYSKPLPLSLSLSSAAAVVPSLFSSSSSSPVTAVVAWKHQSIKTSLLLFSALPKDMLDIS